MEFTFRPLEGWLGDKTRHPERSRFKANYSQTLEVLDRELGFLNATNIVIQLDVTEREIRIDGLPRSDAHPKSAALILAFDSKYGPLKYATDTFDRWKDNLRAIALGLEALRKVDRYGITKRGEQYKGWKQLTGSCEAVVEFDLESASMFINDNCEEEFRTIKILTDTESYRRAYRSAARKLHPDKNPDDPKAQAEFCKLQDAKRILDTHFGT